MASRILLQVDNEADCPTRIPVNRARYSDIGQNHWAKEFVIVFGDGYADGLEAFLTAYHGIEKPGAYGKWS